ncbi:MAG: hypothetical protein KIT16_02805, partial [Rhodospirillaceae bacterium]|nr:hypothetical protein [Rhodospirillaceae bacterium]
KAARVGRRLLIKALGARAGARPCPDAIEVSMKKTLLGAALALLVLAPGAHAACTLQDVSQKAQAFAQKYQEVANKDVQRAQRFAPKAQEAAQKYQEAIKQHGQSYDDICRLYDELLAELDKSAQ